MKKSLLLSIALLFSTIQIAPIHEQKTDQTEKVTEEEKENNHKKSIFFSQLRYFAIATLVFSSAKIITDRIEKADSLKSSDIFAILGEGLATSFYIWMTDKMKHLDPIADYYTRHIDKQLEELESK